MSKLLKSVKLTNYRMDIGWILAKKLWNTTTNRLVFFSPWKLKRKKTCIIILVVTVTVLQGGQPKIIKIYINLQKIRQRYQVQSSLTPLGNVFPGSNFRSFWGPRLAVGIAFGTWRTLMGYLPYQLVGRISEPSTVRYIGISLSAWWFLIWQNMLVKLGSFPQWGMKIKQIFETTT